MNTEKLNTIELETRENYYCIVSVDDIEDEYEINSPEIKVTSIKINGTEVVKSDSKLSFGEIYKTVTIVLTDKGKKKIFKAARNEDDSVSLDYQKDYKIDAKQTKITTSKLPYTRYTRQTMKALNAIYGAGDVDNGGNNPFSDMVKQRWENDLEEVLDEIIKSSKFIHYMMLPTDGLTFEISVNINWGDEDYNDD